MIELGLDHLGCEELARDIRAGIEATLASHVRTEGGQTTVEAVFCEAMGDVTQGLHADQRNAELKQFIAFGSLLPSWETRYRNSGRSISDKDVAARINYVGGQIVTKFQGKLAELLASAPIRILVDELRKEGHMPRDGELIFGGAIRCRPHRTNRRTPSEEEQGVEGPDAVFCRKDSRDGLEVEVTPVFWTGR